MRLYRAICAWLEADAKAKLGNDDHEPHPEGNNFTQAEYAHSYTQAPELHAGHRGQSLDDDDSGAHHRHRIGFTRN